MFAYTADVATADELTYLVTRLRDELADREITIQGYNWQDIKRGRDGGGFGDQRHVLCIQGVAAAGVTTQALDETLGAVIGALVEERQRKEREEVGDNS